MAKHFEALGADALTAAPDQGPSAGQRDTRHPIDVEVGKRIRLRRLLLGFSQAALGNRLGVTFQQIQKYEAGANRVSASRLAELAAILAVPVTYFFDLPSTAGEAASIEAEFLYSPETRDLIQLYYGLPPSARRAVINLLRALSDRE